MLQSQIIKQRKKQLKLRIDDIMEATGASRPSVCRWLAGTTKKIAPEKLQRLAVVLQTTPDHLLGKDDVSTKKPIYEIVKAGYNIYAEENINGYVDVSEDDALQGDFYLRAYDDSMINARICNGDLLYVKSCDDVESGQVAIVLISDNKAIVRRIIKKDNLLILEAANPSVENCYFNEKDIEELGVRIIGRVLHIKLCF